MTKVRKMTILALLAAIGFLLMFFIEFPLPFFPPYLKYDPAEVAGLLAAFSFGPAAGLAVEVIKNLLFLLSGKSTAGVIGVAANLVAGGSLVVGTGLVYRANGWRSTVMALITGTLCMTGVMAVANYFIFLPLWGIPMDQVGSLLVAAIIPFNLVKGIITSVVTLILFQGLKGKISFLDTRATG